jgi:hypothetical protein
MPKHPNPYHSTARVATAIKPNTRAKLAAEQWQVHTTDDITEKAVLEYLTRIGQDAEVVPFHYSGKAIPGIRVPFEVVEYLKKNEVRVPYKFEAYHRERSTVPWKLWLKGVKSVSQVLGKNFQGTHPTTIIKKAA